MLKICFHGLMHVIRVTSLIVSRSTKAVERISYPSLKLRIVKDCYIFLLCFTESYPFLVPSSSLSVHREVITLSGSVL